MNAENKLKKTSLVLLKQLKTHSFEKLERPVSEPSAQARSHSTEVAFALLSSHPLVLGLNLAPALTKVFQVNLPSSVRNRLVNSIEVNKKLKPSSIRSYRLLRLPCWIKFRI